MDSNFSIQHSASIIKSQRRIHTVSELTAKVKALLEDNFPFVWICGEISNFRVPASGHFYFTMNYPAAELRGIFAMRSLQIISAVHGISVYRFFRGL